MASLLRLCVASVVSQALQQAHDPGIQAKLLAMQRQMQLTDNAATPPLAPARSVMTHDLPAPLSAVRHNRVLTAEQKEEQTR